jgi:phytoene synthase
MTTAEGPTTRPPAAELTPKEITARSGSNFLAGFVCLERERRDGMEAIYAFCRVVDDAVDDAPDQATGRRHLDFWRHELAVGAAGNATTPVGRAVQRTAERFGPLAEPLTGLVRGCELDLLGRGCADEAELRQYCHFVASCVGRACLPVLGAAGGPGERFADALGQALQWTNVLRDLRPDAEQGRIYAPRTWLDELAIDPQWLRGGAADAVYADDGPMAALAARFVVVARREFAEARAVLRGMPMAARRGLVPARIMGAIYGALLDRLERRRGEIRLPRTRVGKATKLWLAAAVLAGVRA